MQLIIKKITTENEDKKQKTNQTTLTFFIWNSIANLEWEANTETTPGSSSHPMELNQNDTSNLSRRLKDEQVSDTVDTNNGEGLRR